MTNDPATDLGYESYKAFAAELSVENDRSAVILGAARLDIGLRHLLEHVLAPNTSTRDELLDNDGPLSSFSARIQMSFRLGLITADFVRALNLVRKIRNDFAHEASGASLTSGAHHDRVRELSRPFIRQPGYCKYRDRN